MRILLSFLIILFVLPTFAQRKEKRIFELTVDEKLPNLALNQFYKFWQNPAFSGYEKKQNIQSFSEISYPFESFVYKYDINGKTKEIKLHHPIKYFAGYDAALFKKRKFAAGIFFSHQREGLKYSNLAGISLAYKFNFNTSNNLRLGISSSINKQYFDFSQSTFGDQIHSEKGFIYQSWETEYINDYNKNACFCNWNFSFIYNLKKLNISIAAINFNRPINSFFNNPVAVLPRFYDFSMIYKFSLYQKIKLYPAIRVQWHYPVYSLYDISIYTIFSERLMIGSGYYFTSENSGSCNLNLGINLNDKIQFNTRWSIVTNKDMQELGKISNIDLGLLYQFGRTKLNLIK
ncbi:MAG: type IX secretion system membrane protein PorP/SprF [Bacteroidota bacterium]|nr:type IX secretion system membrane protein PorP/SprF [Bacteroidota bacterium]